MSRFTEIPALLVAAMLTLGAPSPAFAHDDIVDTTPPNGGSVENVPTKVVIEFAREPASGRARVTGPSGDRNLAGPPEIQGTTLTVPLTSVRGPGWYTVEVAATSADGHPIEGTFEFEVTGPQSDGRSVSSEPVGDGNLRVDDVTAETSTTGESRSTITIGLGVAALVAGSVVAAWWAFRRRRSLP